MRKQKGYPNLIVQPEKFTPERARAAADILKATGSFRKAAQAAGVSRLTLKKWSRKPEFQRAFERWQKFNWSRQTYQGQRAKENLKEMLAKESAETGEIGSQNALEDRGGYPDPYQPGKRLSESETSREDQFSIFPSEQEMWRQWEEEQERKRQAEIQKDVIEGTWTG